MISTRRVAFAALVTVVSTHAFAAGSKAECVAASEKAQQLKDDRKLLQSREQFLACARDTCPPAVKKDCADQVADLDKRTPSVVFRAKDKNGQDLVAVHVTGDGAALTEQLDGRGIPLDPGQHTFRFEAQGNDPVEQKVVLAEGEHNRSITVQFGHPDVAPPPTQPAKKGAPIGAFVLGGVGLVAMGVAPIFYAMGLSQKSTDETAPNGCKFTGGCSDSEINSIQTKLIIGDVFMFGGAALLAGGIIWTIVHYAGGNKEAPAAQGMRFDVAPTFYGRGAVASTTIRW